jgi:GTP-binding protein Era
MNVRMVDSAVETLREVDIVGVVVDVSEAPGAGIRYLFDLLKDTRAKTILILNKIDLIKKHRMLPLIDQLSKERDWEAIVPVSAVTGDNVAHLEEVLLNALPEGEPLYPDDYLTDQPERDMAAEMVREQVLRLTRDELPFSTAVLIDQFQEPDEEDPRVRIYATILVERESQKPIVIGKGGEVIKEIGTAARREMQEFFQGRVFLDLRVAVREEWREDDRMLDRLGVKGSNAE